MRGRRRRARARRAPRRSDVEAFAHGMTVATNALLEGGGARTALVATEGFTDVVELGRQARADLYRLCAAHPAPLVPPERRVAARERMGPDGVLRAARQDARARSSTRSRRSSPRRSRSACCTPTATPSTSSAIGEALARAPARRPRLAVARGRRRRSASTSARRRPRSTPRSRPCSRAYLRRLRRARAARPGLPEPPIMQSSGGLADAGAGRRPRRAHRALRPGRAAPPARRCVAARRGRARPRSASTWAARRATSASSRAARCARRRAARSAAARSRCRWSTSTRSAPAAARSPGATRAARCASARARRAPSPGPACYGRGGDEPTVTDANLVLGRCSTPAPLAGGVDARPRGGASARSSALADELEPRAAECAEGIVRVANAEMVRALRVMTVERGVDPRELRAARLRRRGRRCTPRAIADELGMRARSSCPRASGVLSALGLAAADRRRDVQRTVLLRRRLDERSRRADELARQARERLGDERRRAERRRRPALPRARRSS